MKKIFFMTALFGASTVFANLEEDMQKVINFNTEKLKKIRENSISVQHRHAFLSFFLGQLMQNPNEEWLEKFKQDRSEDIEKNMLTFIKNFNVEKSLEKMPTLCKNAASRMKSLSEKLDQINQDNEFIKQNIAKDQIMMDPEDTIQNVRSTFSSILKRFIENNQEIIDVAKIAINKNAEMMKKGNQKEQDDLNALFESINKNESINKKQKKEDTNVGKQIKAIETLKLDKLYSAETKKQKIVENKRKEDILNAKNNIIKATEILNNVYDEEKYIFVKKALDPAINNFLQKLSDPNLNPMASSGNIMAPLAAQQNQFPNLVEAQNTPPLQTFVTQDLDQDVKKTKQNNTNQ